MIAKISKPALVLAFCFALIACGGDESATPSPSQTSGQTNTSAANPSPAAPTTSQATNADKPEPAPAVQASVSPEALQAKASLPADAGQKRYETTCQLCHDKGLLNAPKRGDTAEWQKRLTKGKDILYWHSAKGFNKMPAQAVGDVSEAEVYAAVDYLLEKSL